MQETFKTLLQRQIINVIRNIDQSDTDRGCQHIDIYYDSDY